MLMLTHVIKIYDLCRRIKDQESVYQESGYSYVTIYIGIVVKFSRALAL